MRYTHYIFLKFLNDLNVDFKILVIFFYSFFELLLELKLYICIHFVLPFNLAQVEGKLFDFFFSNFKNLRPKQTRCDSADIIMMGNHEQG